MTATSTPSRPDPTRTGAVWVTGTGAFLLLAAAAVFTAMRWEQIPDAAKLGALALVTGACLIAGRGLKATLPATAGALFHLGAFLVPLDVAAVGVRAGLDWSGLLLAEGVAATITFWWAARTERSVVLEWAGTLAVVALAGGIGATTSVPAPLALAGAGLAAVALRRHDQATVWAATAGLAPLLAFFDELTVTGAGTLERLGLTGSQPRLAATATGVTAALALAVVGRRRDDVGQVLIGAGLAALGVTASWTGAGTSGSSTIVGLATGFLLLQVVALATADDPFWRIPSDVIARVAEAIAGPLIVVVGLVVVAFAGEDLAEPSIALASSVLALGWVVADRRRAAPGSGLVTGALAASLAVAVATTPAAAAEPGLLALGLVAIAAGGALRGRRGGLLVAVVAAISAPLVTGAAESAAFVALAGALGSLVLAEAAVRHLRATGPGVRPLALPGQAQALALVALVPGALAVASLLAATDLGIAVLLGGAVLATVVAAVCDRGALPGEVPLGAAARVASVAVLLGVTERPAHEVAVVAMAVAGLSLLDALRRDEPTIALGAAVALPVGIGAAVAATGLSLPATGVALSIGAVVLAGLGALAGRRWAVPAGTAVVLAAAGGLGLAAADPATFADAVMVTSGLGLAVAIERGRLDGVYLAGTTLTGGLWIRLHDAEVVASEAYLAPVALLLLIAGVRARSIGTSSWIAYGPVVGILGGAALAERIAGGGGGHALLAGAVGVVSVAVGGQRRLAAPLFLGTALLVALAGYETLALTAGLPTWTWLALGGTVLLGAGVAMERHDLGPLETGRRLVDVVDERFA
jgi:hypothetical protein